MVQDATCCDDHEHCCPSNLPVCDTTAGRCLSGNSDDWESSVPWSKKVLQFPPSGGSCCFDSDMQVQACMETRIVEEPRAVRSSRFVTLPMRPGACEDHSRAQLAAACVCAGG